jgi:hypothetical protein
MRLGFALAAILAVTMSAEIRSAEQISKKTRTTGPQERPSAFVLGRVIDASGKQPIAGARVSLGGRDGGRGSETVLTNSGGYFLFRDLAAGTYTIAANAAGYLAGGLGQRAPGGRTQPLTVAAGQRSGDLVVTLWKAAGLSGTVTDERADPVPGLAVCGAAYDGVGIPAVVASARRAAVGLTQAE